MSARFGPLQALTCQLLSFFRSGLARLRTTKRHQRRSGRTALTGSLLLVDIEIETLSTEQPLKQPL
jgi:hypothetical protein